MLAGLMRRSWRVWWLPLASACTPLGAWIYDDPVVTVSRVRLDSAGEGTSPVVALDLKNPNDYVLSTTRVELSLVLDGLIVGSLDQDPSFELPKGIATVSLPLRPSRSTTPARLRALSSGTHRFTVEGRATFGTPLGPRLVHFAQSGDMPFGAPVVDSTSADSVSVDSVSVDSVMVDSATIEVSPLPASP
jgi:hypothetical protein